MNTDITDLFTRIFLVEDKVPDVIVIYKKIPIPATSSFLNNKDIVESRKYSSHSEAVINPTNGKSKGAIVPFIKVLKLAKVNPKSKIEVGVF